MVDGWMDGWMDGADNGDDDDDNDDDYGEDDDDDHDDKYGRVPRQLSWMALTRYIYLIDPFMSSLCSPNGRHLPAVGAVQRDCRSPLKKRWKFPPVTWAHKGKDRDTRQSWLKKV